MSCARAVWVWRWRAGAPLIFIACATLTALAVVSAGTVGFVGLITPHAVRMSFRTSDHRIVAPAAALAGGMLLALADLVARTIAAPASCRSGPSWRSSVRRSSWCCCASGRADGKSAARLQLTTLGEVA